jgi:DtxR family Mn-dependent transcriptional regulator
MEHSLSDEVCDAICRMLEAPARCPGGKRIYPCGKGIDTCNECHGSADKERSIVQENVQRYIQRKIIPITDLPPYQKGIIALLRGSKKVIQRLSDLGSDPQDRGHPGKKDPTGWSY